VDSADRDRIDEARQELHRIIGDREMRNALLLVFANKQDIPGGTSPFPPFLQQLLIDPAMSPAEITEKLQLHKLKDHLWFVHPSCATTAEGLFEGLVQYSNDTLLILIGMVITKCKAYFSKIIFL
jgi:ADP-ribosylation factor 6